MRLRKIIRKSIRRSGPGGTVAGGVNVVVAANVDEPGNARTSVSSRQRVVQRGGRTEVTFEGPDERRPRGADQANEGGES
jgi:hypothetical protein